MRHITSDHISDFSAIYDDNVELVSVTRENAEPLVALAEDLFETRAVLELQWQQEATDTEAPLRAMESTIDKAYLPALADEISHASDVLQELLGCEAMGVRLATLSKPMCPRFHNDHVNCRMLMTISGPATEWIATDEVDKEIFADRSQDAPPVKTGGKIRQFDQGCWSLLKGGNWQDEFDGVIHRSPHQDGQRLLLTFDPIFA